MHLETQKLLGGEWLKIVSHGGNAVNGQSGGDGSTPDPVSGQVLNLKNYHKESASLNSSDDWFRAECTGYMGSDSRAKS